MISSRTRFWLTLSGIALLLTAVAGLVARGVARRAALSLASPVAAGSQAPGTPPRGPASPGSVEGDLLVRTLSGAVRFERLHHRGGTTARLERLQIPLGAGTDRVVQIPSAELELDVSSMSVRGLLDGAPIARSLIAGRLPFLELGSAATLPMRINVPARALGSVAAWSVSADLAGQRLSFRPGPLFKPVPMQVSRGRVSFDRGKLALEDLELAFGTSSVGLTAGIKDALELPVFDRSVLAASLDLVDLIMPQVARRPGHAAGRLAVRMEVSGRAHRPDINGTLTGGLDVPSLPISEETAGLPDREVLMRFPRIEGRIASGKEASLVSADLDTGPGEAWFASRMRRFGFRGQGARANLSLEGVWSALRANQTVELKRGQLEYKVLAVGETGLATGALTLPYESMRFETAARERQVTYRFSAALADGGLARLDVGVDRSGKPAETSYGLDTGGLDLSPITASLFNGQLAVRGRLTMRAGGRADRMAVVRMRGEGRGTISGFCLDWRGASGSLEDLDLADLIRAAVAPAVTVELPSFGRTMLLKLTGAGRGFQVAGEVSVDINLGYQGRFDYVFERQHLSTRAAAETALLRRGGSNRLAMRLRGEPHQPPVIELFVP